MADSKQFKHTVHLYLAAPDCAAGYQAQLLSAADRAYLQCHPTRAAQPGWQVSRFLKQQANTVSGSLSHSGGYAVLAVSQPDFAVGVDLELLRPRRFDAWPDWVLHPDEKQWLRQSAGLAAGNAWDWHPSRTGKPPAELSGIMPHQPPLTQLYVLWTLKEALLKANHLALADLPQVGLRRRGGWQLCAADRLWRGASFLLDGQFVCSTVWPHETEAGLVWEGFGAWQTVLRQPIYRWPA